MKRGVLLFAVALWSGLCVAQGGANPPNLKPGDNMVLENVPAVPMTIAEATAPYGDGRPATLFGWHPARREMLIGTRFGDTVQVHSVAMPGGARTQMTFYPDRVSGAKYLPGGNSFLFTKDVGGGEWFQIYRWDLQTGKATLLTDGKSRNEGMLLARHSSTLAFSSTRRTGKDTDVWVMDARNPGSARMLLQGEGGGWEPVAWSPDGSKLLVMNYVSVNESYLWLVDAATGDKKLLTPRGSGEPVSYSAAVFGRGNDEIYVTTDKGNEFARLTRVDLGTMKMSSLSSSIPWDVEEIAITEDGRSLAFATNENGLSRLYALDTKTDKVRPLSGAPAGVVSGLEFRDGTGELGFEVNSAGSPSDVYSMDLRTGKTDRWTRGETGGLDAGHLPEPKLISWKSFDGKEISGWLTMPDPVRFAGKRPVIVAIHGGPEGQTRPTFLGQANYFVKEMGIALLEPNVRGSSGYGKTFVKLDNGFHRDDTYKDIGALLDWIKSSPELDADRVMVYGGSYGGHMTWAVAAFYNDRIRCALPVVGMSNLVTFLEHTEAYRRDLRRAEYGDERDPAMRAYLEKIAPMNHLDAMHKPMFAVVGKNDPRVPWTESRQILDKLHAQGTPTWFMMANDEGHGYAKKKNRDFLFDAEVLFVERYLLDGMSQAGASAGQ